VIARIALWSLADADTTIEELRASVQDETEGVPGLVFHAWISNEASERWGALSVFASREAAEQAPSGPLPELIGRPPDLFEEFDVETTLDAVQ
jgi:hypothetical protein